MKIVNELDEPVWNTYVRQHPHGNIFHTPEMFAVLSRAKGHEPELWAVLDDGGRPLALFIPVRISIAGGPLKRLTTRAVAYGSLLCNPGAEGEAALSSLLDGYKRSVRRSILFTELRNIHDLGSIQSICGRADFIYEEHLNYLVDLECSRNALMERLGARTRKHIRRALRKKELVLEEVTQRSLMREFYAVLSRTYTRARVFLAGPTLFEAAFEVLYPRGMARFLIVRFKGTPVAVSAELLFKKTIFGWYGGLDRSYSKYNANEFLTWHILDWGRARGYKVYDFGGAGNPEEEYGVRDFKAKFKGELVGYGRNICVHNPGLLRLSRAGYRIYQFFLPLKNIGRMCSFRSRSDTLA